ncbi:unnamed protein product [Malassezia sympodialis ATCC 42132]|uniref:Domain of unknown function at the cortex 1 domain-containing protein n=1 Tax=Malassezia sympodialis (strain ATCC 42132) TaxID=1230383 RepID=M5E620_MALS4|nr:uncharacterized protein MSY001_0555 [Malassezia sympodialis ATCC 42132]CCU97849.1 unnamed protein product [Malassezia sympodialis ATCC 42132]SHO77771.1 Uncharacterized protein MSYG_2113 [Malassezia sympodialis ATCC 42132]|eukprot:XP_018739181.1 uncharacterized protein MSY001_0555 [Malassezia sympodialis ATCC 42132]
MPHLEVKVGPDRFHMEPCRLNDTKHPHEINTEHFVGRVLVRILDAPGAKPGDPAREYFTDRSRRFCIQIEGRFKKPWSGDDILFGSDFDKFVPFPRAPFNAGMRVARMIDPCTFYEEHPPSGRPYIMSPYAACMNVFCAWPSPDRLEDAVVVEHEHGEQPSLAIEHQNEGDDCVPLERVSHRPDSATPDHDKKRGWMASLRSSKETREMANYWRFIGFRDDPRVKAYVEQQRALPSAPAPSPSLVAPKAVRAAGMRQGIDTRLMTSLGSSRKHDLVLTKQHHDRADTPKLPVFLSSNLHNDAGEQYTMGTPGLTRTPDSIASGRDSALSQSLMRMSMTPSPATSLHAHSTLDDWLGPWRFADPSADMVEDNAFIFTDRSVSVPKRRKHFADEKNRKAFVYDPNIVYGASFFSNLFDFTTFDLSIGPVHLNVHPFFTEMPIRYTLRSKTNEEVVFCTISFQLVN